MTGPRLTILLAASALAVAVATASQAAQVPRFLGCTAFTSKHPAGTVRPTSVIAACADANFYFSGLHWSSWTAAGAAATGTAHQNDCTPYCAAGHFHAYPATVRLSAPQRCGGRLELTKLSWRFTATKPKGTPRTGSESFRCV